MSETILKRLGMLAGSCQKCQGEYQFCSMCEVLFDAAEEIELLNNVLCGIAFDSGAKNDSEIREQVSGKDGERRTSIGHTPVEGCSPETTCGH